MLSVHRRGSAWARGVFNRILAPWEFAVGVAILTLSVTTCADNVEQIERLRGREQGP